MTLNEAMQSGRSITIYINPHKDAWESIQEYMETEGRKLSEVENRIIEKNSLVVIETDSQLIYHHSIQGALKELACNN